MSKLFSYLDVSTILGAARFEIRTYRNYLVNEVRFDRVAPPREPIEVNPLEIEQCVSAISIEDGLGQINGGDWDDPEELERLEEHSIYRGLRQRFVEGKEWEETDRFKYAKRALERHGSFNNYTGVEQFLSVRCEFVDELFASIRDDGYRPNFEGGHRVPDVDVRNTHYRFFHKLEPLLAIGAGGDLFWIDGFHRITIARLLGITSIPVNVLCRHCEWQRLRDGLYNSERTHRSVAPHPDLQAL